MPEIELVFYLLAVVLAVLAGIPVPSRVNLLAFAVACAVMPSLLNAIETVSG